MKTTRSTRLRTVNIDHADLNGERRPGALSRRVVIAGLGISGLCIPLRARAQQADKPNAWDILIADPRFSEAVSLFEYAGLVQYVQTNHFTAFVPTNNAFNKNPDVLPSLLRQRNRAFPDTTLAVNFVRSHALQDLHPLSEFSGRSQTLTAISGSPLTIDGRSPGVYTVTWTSIGSKTGTARIGDNPIVASNALIYPVDTVVLTEKTI